MDVFFCCATCKCKHWDCLAHNKIKEYLREMYHLLLDALHAPWRWHMSQTWCDWKLLLEDISINCYHSSCPCQRNDPIKAVTSILDWAKTITVWQKFFETCIQRIGQCLCLFVCLLWVCGTYFVHHYNSTELHYCTVDLHCAPNFFRSRGQPQHFSFLVVQWITAVFQVGL